MTTATLPHARQYPDWNRAFALGTAIAINLAALGALAVMQPSWQPTALIKPAERMLEAYLIEAPLELPLVPPAPARATVAIPVPTLPIAVAATAPTVVEAAQVEATAFQDAESAVVDIPGAAIGFESVPGVPVDRDAGVALADPSPPPYPIAAIRKRHEGSVLLEVMVSATGAATEVRVLRGSGHTELDRSARDHVLKSWSFQPALREGQPVAARVQVPIEFALDNR